MLIRDIMTKKVITVTSKTSVGDAQKLMKERNLRRLPVVDEGRLVGLVTLERLEQIKPKTDAPLLWQITYLQKVKVGTLIVVNRGQIVGICTTNDFFYKIVNPTLGLGESGTRILVSGKDIGQSAEKIISCINNLGIEIKVLWAIAATEGNKKEIVLHLETEDTAKVIKELEQLGCTAKVLAR
jgi:acetoin utilization protein AcuB